MKPAAPVTTMYKTYPPRSAAHDERDARRDRAQQFIADGRRQRCDLVDRQSFAPQHDVAADRASGTVDRSTVTMSIDTRPAIGTRFRITSTGVPLGACRG